MPGKPRTLRGEDVIRILTTFGFQSRRSARRHAKLRRLGAGGERQTLHIPLHREIRRGTLRAIYQQALQYIADDELRGHFYTE